MSFFTRALRTTLILSTLAAAAAAADLDGTWRIDLPRPSGVVLHSLIRLHQAGPRIEGSVLVNGVAELGIEGAHVDGEDIVFGLNWGWTLRVHAEGPNLRVAITYGGGGRDDALAVPATEADLRVPAPLPVPEEREVPDNGLARTPPMGWNSWNHFAERVDDAVVRRAADAMVRSGMAAAGYVYINIDDTWEGGRDRDGNIVPNRKFPDMKALADFVHAKGLKLGIYSSPGPLTCGGYEGSYGHEEEDARTYAAWGIDYLKYDWCSAGRIYPDTQLRPVYQKMGEALEHCGRPIVFSLCEYGMGYVWTWGHRAGGNLWRTTGDIQDNWKSMERIGFDQGRLAPFAGPGHWNDPDMLEVGNGGMSRDEYRTHFSLWCLLAAPLMAGNDLSTMSEETRALLTNREVISIDQDILGIEATRVSENHGIEVWSKPLHAGREAIGIFNRGELPAPVSLSWSELGRPSAPRAVRDAWQEAELPADGGGYHGVVPAHGVAVLILK